MKKKSSPTFFEKLSKRTGRWYPLLILLFIQSMNTSMFLLLTVMPARQNTEMNNVQATSMLIFGIVAVLIRNFLLLGQFSLFHKELLFRLSQVGKKAGENVDIKQEKRIWEQATSASNRYALLEFLELVLLVILPVMAYGYFNLQIEAEDILQISLAALAAGLVNLIVGYLVLDKYFKPILKVVVPKRFDIQLSGLKGIRLWVKVTAAIVGVAVISMLLIVPSAYHQMHIIFWDIFRFPQVLDSALWVVVNAGIGAIAVGIFLSFRLASYFTRPFRKMIDLYKKVEGGDLSQRIEVSHTDEFGELNIYLNRMIERLEKLTTSLEQQVIERTEQLSQANEQLKERGIQLRELAVRDSLTGLYNRRYLDVMLEREFSRAERKQLPLGIIMIDIDHFKQYNDTHGHAAGDLLLMHVGEMLKGFIRMADIACRYGGEEFVLVLPEATLDITQERAENIRMEVKQLKITYEEQPLENVTLSLGVAVFPTHGSNSEEILKSADEALYRAKAEGRDRVVVKSMDDESAGDG